MDLLPDLAPDDPGAAGWLIRGWPGVVAGVGGRSLPWEGSDPRHRDVAVLRSPGDWGGCWHTGELSGALLFPWKGRRIWGLDGAGGTSKRQHSSGCCGDAGAEREPSSAEPGSVFELQIQTQRGKNPGQSRGDASPDVSGGIRPCLHTQHAFIH